MTKRSVCFGAYDTALYGWTLTGCQLGDAEQKTKYVEKVGGDGSWDLSTALTDGVPRYNDRPLTVTLECSEGTRDERQELIGSLVNQLDGLQHDIILPDYPSHYITGRVHVAVEYNDLAHCAVTITGTCAPWLYRMVETVVNLTAATDKQTANLRNTGRLVVVPDITITGDDASVLLEFNEVSVAMGAGVYTWPQLALAPGNNVVTFSGSGEVSITYREAVLR